MSNDDLHQRLNRASEITLSVKGRKSGKDIPRPVWFTYEGSILYLLPVQGSDTNWYKNLLLEPMVKISINGVEMLARGQPITDSNSVNEVVKKFKFKMLIAVVVTLLFSMTISQSIPLSFGLSSNVSLYALDDCKSGATESFRYHTNAEYNSIFYTQGYNWNHVSCNNSGSDISSTQSSNTDTGTYHLVIAILELTMD